MFQLEFLGAGWAGQTYQFVKSAGVYKCPDDSTATIAATGTTPTLVPVSYGWNIDLNWDGHNGGPATALSQLQAPARQVMLFEISNDTADITNSLEANPNLAPKAGGSVSGNGTTGFFPGCQPAQNGCSAMYATGVMGGRSGTINSASGQTQHTNGSNFLLCDGHVKWLLPSAVSLRWNAANPNAAQDNNSSDSGVGGVEAEGTNSSKFVATFSGI